MFSYAPKLLLISYQHLYSVSTPEGQFVLYSVNRVDIFKTKYL